MINEIIGYIAFLAIALVMGNTKNLKTQMNWQPIAYGIVFQILIAFAVTNLPIFVLVLEKIAKGVMSLRDATLEGTKFVFGYVGGGEVPFEIKENSSAFIFAFQALPTVILVGALSAILTYLKILPFFAKIIGYVFKLVFKIRESVGMVCAAKIFIGQLEAPLLIKNQLDRLPKSDIFIIMALAFATTSASVMPIYAGVLESICPDAMKHLLISSLISVISVLIISSIIAPRCDYADVPLDNNTDNSIYSSFMGAMSKGLADGAFVWWSIVGSLLGMVALITFINYLFAQFPDCGGESITLQRIFGIIMYPFAWLMGIESKDIIIVSQILGTKLVLNETIAFFDLAKAAISQSSVVKTIYAINNFGNFSCIGITVGGMLALAPNQKNITLIALKTFIAGFLATGLTATLMGVFFNF
ncbi:MAG: hypothetical protein LBE97_01655 [Holosporales bacterium]|nr:hypothetical protein [Holosporales bacterium]